MFLKELWLEDFVCHHQLYLSFQRPVKEEGVRKTTFILGENGTGKSAVLKAIALLTAGSGGLSDVIGRPDDWIRIGQERCIIKAVITTQKGDDRTISLEIRRGDTIARMMQQNKESLEQLDAAIAHADRNYFVAAYGAYRRLGRRDSGYNAAYARFSSPRSRHIQSLFDPDIPLVSLSNWAVEVDYRLGEKGMAVIRKALNDFLADQVQFEGIDKSRKSMLFTTADGPITLEQLSDGYQDVIAWVGDLLYNITTTFGDYRDPMKARGLLLIDEIDLHLHPKWQRLLHFFLLEKLPNFQVIATTHSPLTAQQADEGELYALKREGAAILLVPFKGAPSRMLLHELLMSPLFGLVSDESLRVQQAREVLKEVKGKKRVSAALKARAKESEALLASVPMNIRSGSLLNKGEWALLQSIHAQLKESGK
jgi:predicted ATPase